MKYIALLGIIIIGSLLFINKDKLFSQNSENLAVVASAAKEKPLAKCTASGFTGSYLCVSCPKVGYDVYRSDYTTARCEGEYATSTKKIYTLTVQQVVANRAYGSQSLGSVTPGTGKYAEGTTAVLTGKPINGFKVLFDGPCEVKGQDTCKVKMNSDKTVKVSFEQKPGWKCGIVGGYLVCSKVW